MLTLPDEMTHADRLGFIGDTHGDLTFTLRAIRSLSLRGVPAVVVAGDFGFVWGRDRAGLNALSAAATELKVWLMFVDGNHEDFDALYAFPVGDDGIRWVAPRIGHLPRGSRFSIQGLRFAVMGGANSIDRWHRREGVSWWSGEQISDDDLERLGSEPVDVLISHDAPEPLPMLDQRLRMTKKYWSLGGLAYAARGRTQFTRAFRQVRPATAIGGHYHCFVDQVVHVEDEAGEFDCQVVLLDMNEGSGPNCAVLSIPSVAIEAFHV